MIFSGKSLKDITLEEIQRLVHNRIPEGPHLDYKLTAYSGREQDRREMLRDVAALANAEGGYIVLGIEEDGANYPLAIRPIKEAEKTAQAIRQTCLDGIRDRIEGLEVQAYLTEGSDGVIVLNVPPSELRPHMVTLGQRTDFFKRYDTDKRPMTLAEIREAVSGNQRFLYPLELLLQAHGILPQTTKKGGREFYPAYTKLLTSGSVESFIQKFLAAKRTSSLVIVSPFIGDLAGTRYPLQDVIDKINKDRTITFVVTREPKAAYQHAGMNVLKSSPYTEIRVNEDVHAKVYIAWNGEAEESFAMFGSGNLTTQGMGRNLELGVMIFPYGDGKLLIEQLYRWSSETVRTMSKRIKHREVNNG